MGLDDVYVPVRSKERRQRRHLPGDLLPEILSRVPVKSLLRFRCVSKSWLSLVDDDADFARLHLNTFENNRDENRLLVFENGIDYNCVVRCSDTFEPISETPLMYVPGNEDSLWDIVSCVDGLILLRCFKNVDDGLMDMTLKLWNPSLRDFHDVPPLPPGYPLKDTEICGLGYDPLAKDYKLVKLVFASNTTRLQSVAIYTLGSGSWKIIPFQGNGSSSCSEWRWRPLIFGNVYLKGSLYFVATDGSVRDLVSFDLSNEVFSVVGTKPDDHPNYMSPKEVALIDSGSSVAVLDSLSHHKPSWVLESETMNWTQRSSYPLKNNSRLLHVKKNGDILTGKCRDVTFSDETGEEKSVKKYEVESYSPEKKLFKVLLQNSSWVIYYVYGYVESLILHQCKKNM